MTSLSWISVEKASTCRLLMAEPTAMHQARLKPLRRGPTGPWPRWGHRQRTDPRGNMPVSPGGKSGLGRDGWRTPSKSVRFDPPKDTFGGADPGLKGGPDFWPWGGQTAGGGWPNANGAGGGLGGDTYGQGTQAERKGAIWPARPGASGAGGSVFPRDKSSEKYARSMRSQLHRSPA